MWETQVSGNQFTASLEVSAHFQSLRRQPLLDVDVFGCELGIVKVNEIEVAHLCHRTENVASSSAR